MVESYCFEQKLEKFRKKYNFIKGGIIWINFLKISYATCCQRLEGVGEKRGKRGCSPGTRLQLDGTGTP